MTTIDQLLRSVLQQDKAPVVLCSMDSVIRYMNPAAIAEYHKDLTGMDLNHCHNPQSREKIRRVLGWFAESQDHNTVFTFHDDKENKDVYMVALRDDSGELIGYYEKHEYRTPETATPYSF